MFSKELTDELPPHRKHDHKIELEEGKKAGHGYCGGVRCRPSLNHGSVSEEMENSHKLFEVSCLALENNDVE